MSKGIVETNKIITNSLKVTNSNVVHHGGEIHINSQLFWYEPSTGVWHSINSHDNNKRGTWGASSSGGLVVANMLISNQNNQNSGVGKDNMPWQKLTHGVAYKYEFIVKFKGMASSLGVSNTSNIKLATYPLIDVYIGQCASRKVIDFFYAPISVSGDDIKFNHSIVGTAINPTEYGNVYFMRTGSTSPSPVYTNDWTLNSEGFLSTVNWSESPVSRIGEDNNSDTSTFTMEIL